MFISLIDKTELVVGENNCWIINIDVLVMAELDFYMLDLIALTIRRSL